MCHALFFTNRPQGWMSLSSLKDLKAAPPSTDIKDAALLCSNLCFIQRTVTVIICKEFFCIVACNISHCLGTELGVPYLRSLVMDE